MEVIKSKLIGEKEYIETLENGMKIIIIQSQKELKYYSKKNLKVIVN